MKLDIFGRPHQSIAPTHYNTLGGIRSEYLNIDDSWWLLSHGYQAIDKPVLVTPIGESENIRFIEPKPIKIKRINTEITSTPVDPYKGTGRYKGD